MRARHQKQAWLIPQLIYIFLKMLFLPSFHIGYSTIVEICDLIKLERKNAGLQ